MQIVPHVRWAEGQALAQVTMLWVEDIRGGHVGLQIPALNGFVDAFHARVGVPAVLGHVHTSLYDNVLVFFFWGVGKDTETKTIRTSNNNGNQDENRNKGLQNSLPPDECPA